MRSHTLQYGNRNRERIVVYGAIKATRILSRFL